MSRETEDMHYEQLLERFKDELELPWVSREDEVSYARKVLEAVTRAGIASIQCEIPEREISVNAEGKPNTAIGFRDDRKTLLSKVDEAVHKAEWSSTPTYQSAPPRHQQVKEERAERIVTYNGKAIGRLQYKRSSDEGRRRFEEYMISTASRYIAYAIKRGEIRRWSTERHGRASALIGSDRKIHAIEEKIERSCSRNLPVNIEGEFGTEKLDVAIAIHALSDRKNAPFIDIDCSNPGVAPENYISQAKGGSLCLNNIDQLSLRKQFALQSQINSHLGQWIGRETSGDVRILSTSCDDLAKRVLEGRFLPTLYAELTIVRINIPPIRERKYDISAIVHTLLSYQETDRKYMLQEDAMAILGAYEWPGNLYEIKKLVASMTVAFEGGAISANDLMSHAPWLNQYNCRSHEPESQVKRPGRNTVESTSELERWLQEFEDNGESAKEVMHDGLKKAIQALLVRYAEAITLQDLARVANLSPSHLSYLFRKGTKASFKDIQHCIRITKAKDLLRAERQKPIAEIAEAVGYVDLSHFERTFRRHVGMRPRDYRRSSHEGHEDHQRNVTRRS